MTRGTVLKPADVLVLSDIGPVLRLSPVHCQLPACVRTELCQDSQLWSILMHGHVHAGEAGSMHLGSPDGTGACKRQEACIRTCWMGPVYARTIAVGTSRCSGG